MMCSWVQGLSLNKPCLDSRDVSLTPATGCFYWLSVD